MSHIRGKGTRPEVLVRKYLFSCGFRYRLNVKTLPGCPDIVLPRYRSVIFIDGCFWHGHKHCRYATTPKSNVDFWKRKIETNKARDVLAEKALRELGWNVFRVWECELKKACREETLEKLRVGIVSCLPVKKLAVKAFYVLDDSLETFSAEVAEPEPVQPCQARDSSQRENT